MAASSTPEAPPILISYTLFPSVTPRTKQERNDEPWPDLVERIASAAIYISKAACPLISLGEYGDTLTDKDCIRHAGNVRRIFGVELDYDGEVMGLDEAAALLQAANVETALYTSPSHTLAKPRWRVLAPLSDPDLPEKRAEFVGRLNRILGGIASRESFTLSQSFYIGRVAGAEYQVATTYGATVENLIGIEPLFHVNHRADGESKFDPTPDAELRAAFIRGEGRYQAMLSLSSRWAARGMGQDDIAGALAGLMAECPDGARNADGVDLGAMIPDLAASAARKFGETRADQDALIAAFFAAPAEPLEVIDPAVRPGQDPALAMPGANQGARRPGEVASQPRDLQMRHPIAWGALAAQAPPERSWAVEGWIGHGHVTLLAGPPGAGKTALAQSWGSCIALGLSAVDYVREPEKVLFWAGEDDANELWRRQLGICRWLKRDLEAFDQQLVVQSYPDRDITLCVPARDVLTPTAVLKELREQIGDYGARVVFLDSIARLFGGNENDRHHVTQFIAWLTWALSPTNAALVLLGHPAKATGSEFSGSTAWEASVRARLYFGFKLPDQEPGPDDAPAPDETIRYLAKRKTNYSQKDVRTVQWEDGAMRCQDAPERASARHAISGEFLMDETLRVFRRLVAMGLIVGPSSGKNYLPRIAAQQRLLTERLTERDLRAGVAECMKAGRLVMGNAGLYANRTPRRGLIEP